MAQSSARSEFSAPSTPTTTIRSKRYRVLLVFAALIGVLVSFASWCFLELVHWIQQEVYKTLPSGLGLHPVPWWWPLPVLAVAGVLAAVAILRLPGHGGHIPYEGIKAGTAKPIELPGILLAALATLGLGLVLGPEAPLIALGGGLAILAVRLVKKDTPNQVMAVLAASAAFAAIATIFGSPVIGAIILIEAAGLGGPMLPLVLLPGLMSAGIGSVVFIGMGHWTGLSSSAYALSPFTLPAFSTLTAAEFGWAIALGSPPPWPRSRSPISHAGQPVSLPGSRGCCCRSPPWSSAAWRSGLPRSPTSQRTSSCSLARTPSAP